jgi:hypothetical protein
MSELPKVREGFSERKIHITTTSYTFLCTIHEDNDVLSMYIGGENIYCVSLQAYKPKSVYDTPDYNIKIASLLELYYDRLCSLTGEMKRKISTDFIFKLGISLLKSVCKWITHLKFTDTSKRVCDSGKTVMLPFMNLLIYDKTWYERMFEAKILEPMKQKIFDDKKEAFNKKKEETPWSVMKKIMKLSDKQIECVTEDIHPTKIVLSHVELEKWYTSSTTWHLFFSKLYTCMGAPAFCVFAEPFLFNFQETYLKYYFTDEYVIDITNIIKFPYIPVTGKEYIRTRGKTRKYRKNPTYFMADTMID